MGYTLDLSRWHSKRHVRGFTLIFTWMEAEDGPEPCLVLLREGEELHDHAKPGLVPMRHAWIFDEKQGDDAACEFACATIAHLLRMEDSARSANMVRSVVEDHLNDLLHIPPLPPVPMIGGDVFEVTVKEHETGRVVEKEIKDAL